MTAGDGVTVAHNIAVTVTLTQSSSALLTDACSTKDKKICHFDMDMWRLSGTLCLVHIWEFAPCWTSSNPTSGGGWHRYLSLPLIALTEHWQLGDRSDARFYRRDSRGLMLENSFRQYLPDWQIDKGWLWPLLTAGRWAVCPASTGLQAGWLKEWKVESSSGKHLVLDLNPAVTVGGQAIRYTQCKTQPHAVLNPVLSACLRTIHMYENKMRNKE